MLARVPASNQRRPHFEPPAFGIRGPIADRVDHLILRCIDDDLQALGLNGRRE
jgi:hypothetical protein